MLSNTAATARAPAHADRPTNRPDLARGARQCLRWTAPPPHHRRRRERSPSARRFRWTLRRRKCGAPLNRGMRTASRRKYSLAALRALKRIVFVPHLYREKCIKSIKVKTCKMNAIVNGLIEPDEKVRPSFHPWQAATVVRTVRGHCA